MIYYVTRKHDLFLYLSLIWPVILFVGTSLTAGYGLDDPDRLKWFIKGLRQALGTEAARLENVRGVGYLWQSRTT